MKETLSYSSPDTKHPGGDNSESFLRQLWASVAGTVILTIICCGLYPLLIWGIAQTVFPGKANGSLVKKDGTSTTKDEESVGSALLGQIFTQPGYFHPRPGAANNSPGTAPGGYSASGGYDPTSSVGTNFGPLNNTLINGSIVKPTAPATQPATFVAYDGIRLRAMHYAMDNGISFQLYHAQNQYNADGSIELVKLDKVSLSDYTDSNGLMDAKLIDAFPAVGDDKDRVFLIAADFSKLIPGDAVTASGSGLDPHISPANAQMQLARVAAARNISVNQVQKLIDAHTDQPDLGIFGDPGVNVLMLNLALDAKYPIPAAPASATTAPATQAAQQ